MYGGYTIGLSIAMNDDLQGYLDSRTFVRMAEALSSDRAADKQALLVKAIVSSPFNAEAWYDLYQVRGKNMQNSMDMIAELREALSVVSDGYWGAATGDRFEDLSEFISKPEPLESTIAQYRDTIIAELIRMGFLSNQPRPANYAQFIQAENDDNFYDLSHYYSDAAFEAADRSAQLKSDKERRNAIKRAYR